MWEASKWCRALAITAPKKESALLRPQGTDVQIVAFAAREQAYRGLCAVSVPGSQSRVRDRKAEQKSTILASVVAGDTVPWEGRSAREAVSPRR